MAQIDTLLELLISRTQNGRLSWQETDFADTYEAKFQNYLVRLVPFHTNVMTNALSPFVLQQAGINVDTYVPHLLEIRDGEKKVIERIGIVKPTAASAMALTSSIRTYREIEDTTVSSSIRTLYEAVHRSMDKPSLAIDELIEELQ